MITNGHLKPPPIAAPCYLVPTANFSDIKGIEDLDGWCTTISPAPTLTNVRYWGEQRKTYTHCEFFAV